MSYKSTIIKGGIKFRRIENEPGYSVSKCGKVYSELSMKVLKPYKTHNGYLRIKIRQKNHLIHRLVASTYIGEVGYGNGCKMQVDHIDSDTTNNNLDNLRIINNRDNVGRGYSKHYGAHMTSGGRWMAQIRVNGWLQYLGSFDTKEEARSRYMVARILLQHQGID